VLFKRSDRPHECTPSHDVVEQPFFSPCLSIGWKSTLFLSCPPTYSPNSGLAFSDPALLLFARDLFFFFFHCCSPPGAMPPERKKAARSSSFLCKFLPFLSVRHLYLRILITPNFLKAQFSLSARQVSWAPEDENMPPSPSFFRLPLLVTATHCSVILYYATHFPSPLLGLLRQRRIKSHEFPLLPPPPPPPNQPNKPLGARHSTYPVAARKPLTPPLHRGDHSSLSRSHPSRPRMVCRLLFDGSFPPPPSPSPLRGAARFQPVFFLAQPPFHRNVSFL